MLDKRYVSLVSATSKRRASAVNPLRENAFPKDDKSSVAAMSLNSSGNIDGIGRIVSRLLACGAVHWNSRSVAECSVGLRFAGAVRPTSERACSHSLATCGRLAAKNRQEPAILFLCQSQTQAYLGVNAPVRSSAVKRRRWGAQMKNALLTSLLSGFFRVPLNQLLSFF
jgi:hypothetical protein